MPARENRNKQKTLLIALGGNALIRKGQSGAIEEQFANLRPPLSQIARLSADYRIIITHGNGPQVGDLLNRQECCGKAPRLPLEILVAQTQGQIGYMIESTLDSEFMKQGVHPNQMLASLLSYVVVDPSDPSFDHPSKPVGPVLSETAAAAATYPVQKTAKGLRRVVASPRPLTIVEKREIRQLRDLGFIVICCGGGGIPVVRDGRNFAGVDAVIDKDLASAVLADETGVDILLIATDVEQVCTGYGTGKETPLNVLTVEETLRLLDAGEFPAGSMGPKVSAAAQFISGYPDRRAVICHIDRIEDALSGKAGTRFCHSNAAGVDDGKPDSRLTCPVTKGDFITKNVEKRILT